MSVLENPHIAGLIVQYSGDRGVLWTLRAYIDPVLYREILLRKRRILIYGKVQSGKTAEILDSLKNPLYAGLTKVIVIQNSSLVLNQYKQRLLDAGISEFQAIDHTSRKIHKEVVLLMNNKARYEKYLKCSDKPGIDDPSKKYVLYMDEADGYYDGRHPLAEGAVHEYYITATPRHKLYKEPGYFHTVKQLIPDATYKGIGHLHIEYTDRGIVDAVSKFKEDCNRGMMLINSYRFVVEMIYIALTLSRKFKNIVFVLLNSERKLIIGGDIYPIKQRSLSEIIDLLKDAPRIVFVANRLSLRGLSYCSSDYQRHLTHQYSDFSTTTVTNALQRMRILGKYADDHPLTLYLPSDNEQMVDAMMGAEEMKFKVCREF
jgi:hypothetical protein